MDEVYDLTQRLRWWARRVPRASGVLHEAADTLERLRAAVPWDRTPGLPPVPVSQERYDGLLAKVERLGDELARARRPALAPEDCRLAARVLGPPLPGLPDDGTVIAAQQDVARRHAVLRAGGLPVGEAYARAAAEWLEAFARERGG